ncbi:MAG: hypothetical protein RIF32_13865 [Leptospirales bacterium]
MLDSISNGTPSLRRERRKRAIARRVLSLALSGAVLVPGTLVAVPSPTPAGVGEKDPLGTAFSQGRGSPAFGGFTALNDREPPGFGAGRFFVEIRGAYGLDFGGDIYQNFRDQNRTFPIGPATLLSGDGAAIAASYLSRRSAPQAALESIGGGLALEYALWDWFGIGLDLGQMSLSVKNSRVISAGSEVSFAVISRITGGQASLAGELVYPFVVANFKDYDRISRADLTLGFHPLGGDGSVDPYLKAIGGYGRTKEDGFQVIRYGGALGLRFFVSDWFYVVTEAAWVNNEISGEVQSSVGFFESTNEFEGNLREVNGQLGFGFAF